MRGATCGHLFFGKFSQKIKIYVADSLRVVETSKICNKIVSMIQVMLVLIQHALCLWFYTAFKLMFKDASLGARRFYARFRGVFELFMLLIK
jgi:hypothetical protein